MSGYALRVEPRREVAAPLWRALRDADAPATIGELHAISRAHPNAIQLRLKRWTRVGFVDVLPPEPPRYEIAPKHVDRTEPPSKGGLSADAWAALRRLGRPATLDEIAALSGAADRPLYCRLRRWRRRGLVVKHEFQPRRFVLSPDAPDVAEPPIVTAAAEVKPRAATARERIWAAMRVLKRFDLPQLMMTAEAKRRSCDDFVNFLSRAGYVRCLNHPVTRRGGGNLAFARTWSTYQLIRNTGPKAPIVTNTRGCERRLVDLNTGASVPLGDGVRMRARG